MASPPQPPDPPSEQEAADTALIREVLRATCALLERHGIWHCLTYGTLLGAVRDADIIPWDYDLDLFMRPVDIPEVLALGRKREADGLDFVRPVNTGSRLAAGAAAVPAFVGAHVALIADGRWLGELFAPSLFSDGVLRLYDFATEVVWTPHQSFPHFFLESTSTVSIRDQTYPGVGHPEQFLAGVYGAEWLIPYRSAYAGGVGRRHLTNRGDVFHPKLEAQIAWCEGEGWDRSKYVGQPAWPRRLRGAGPLGSMDRTATTSRALWWRDLDEVGRYY
jgi:hypothetical protein